MKLAPPQLCSGCGSCAAVCPKSCITMESDPEGFRYPRVDTARCVDCGLCRRACPVLEPVPVSEHADAVAAKHRDTGLRMQSSSGGVFSALAEDVFQRDGAVCAAVYGEDFSVAHAISRDPGDLPLFRGAKYAQSRAEQCFPEIRKLLEDGVPVLFAGTPCQTAGLAAYLGKDDPNLLMVDMICHGVPSPLVWSKYLEECESRAGSGIRGLNLRSKSSGWSNYGYSVEIRYADGSVDSVKQGENWFMRGFTGDLYLRPSCSACSFKGTERCSDLTLGDCWGIWENHPEFDDNMGTSLLLIQSDKGRAAWNAVAGSFEWMELDAGEATRFNQSAVRSSAAHPKRTEFFERLRDKDSVESLIRMCLLPADGPRPSLLGRIRKKLFPRK